jgi:hypothetical protein
MQPMQFCQTTSTTGPVDHPGRVYDLTLPINPGFTVDSLIQDEVTQNAGITWSIFDPDGSTFANELRDFIQSRMAGTTVTVTNPNAGSAQVCGNALPMQVHIECLRLDQNPPNLVELVYNAGADLIQNPAYNESPPLSPPVAQGNYGFHLLSRQDDPGPFPGNQPANDALCTSVANRGWETNDVGRTFEIWGQDVASAQNTTPTPRGTPVQEMTSDGPPPGGISTVWQTFQVLAPGTFNIRVVHGARDPGETHRITLSTGDTDDNQIGDVINDVTVPPSVTSSGGPNPWTTFSQSIPLNAGVYTLALSSTDASPDARGGLFTDMRVFIDRPNTRATAVNDDDTCVVTAEETSETTLCTFWTPGCDGGQITSWTNTETGQTLTNTEFWAQTPKPSCCSGAGEAAPGGNGVQSNLVVSDVVCAVIGGVQQNVVREVLFDPSGGELEVAFIGANGARLNPDSWTPGDCVSQRDLHDVILCDRQADGTTISFLRKYVQTWSPALGAQVNEIRDFTIGSPTSTYTVTGTVVNCAQTVNTAQALTLCDSGAGNQQFLRHYQHTGDVVTGFTDTTLDGTTPYAPVGDVVACSSDGDFTTTGLCLGDGTPIGIVNRRNEMGNVVQDGWINLLTGAFSVGNPPVGTMSCGQTLNIQTSDVLCDITTGTGVVNGLVLIQYHYAPDGSITSTDIIDATDGSPYVPVGTITVCPTDTGVPDNDMQVLCDVQANGSQIPLVRDYRRDVNGVINGFADYTVAGVPYATTGTVGSCIPRVTQSLILCDSAATPNRFLRTYTYNSAGAVQGFTDTTLAGAPFVPTGAVNNCVVTTATDFDFTEEVLCDGNGTPFIRRFTFNSTTGAVTSTVNLTLAGGAFAPVGTVGTCTGCCPVVMGEGCTNTGSGRYTALRLANGTISLVDSVTGAAVTQAQIIPCPGSGGTSGVTLTAEARTVTNGAPWTPGADVTGTLTSVTATGTGGLWDMVDASGTALTGLPAGLTLSWSALDGNTLTGPQSITPQAGSTVVVNWTRK